jgi:hypothetical protein
VFVGHLGAALALKRLDRRIHMGTLVLAALLPDLVLWTLVMLGVESVVVPPGFSSEHYLTFIFPWSHGVAASLAWSAAAGLVTWGALGRAFPRRGRAGVIVAAAVLSHVLLDVLVHVPDVPLLGEGSTLLGLGLYRRMPLALALEISIALAGAWVGVPWSALTPPRASGLLAGLAVAAALTVVGGTVAPPPPSAEAAALPAVVSILALAGLASWAERGGTSAGR